MWRWIWWWDDSDDIPCIGRTSTDLFGFIFSGKAGVISGIIITLVTVILMAVTTPHLNLHRRLYTYGGITTGRMDRLMLGSERSVIITYSAQGAAFAREFNLFGTELVINSTVYIFYNPDNPREAILKDTGHLRLLVAISRAGAVAGIGFTIYSFRKSAKEGQKLETLRKRYK